MVFSALPVTFVVSVGNPAVCKLTRTKRAAHGALGFFRWRRQWCLCSSGGSISERVPSRVERAKHRAPDSIFPPCIVKDSNGQLAIVEAQFRFGG